MEIYDESDLDDLSLEEAIRHKYCPPVDYSAVAGDALPSAYNRQITQTALRYKPGGCPVHRRSSIVLDRSKVCTVEGGPELGQLCENVEEMILSSNDITDWTHVCNILSKLPKLSFLDLSHNELDSSSVLEVVSETERELAFDQLKTLVLNCTHFEWSALQECLKMLPNLEELHLSNNDYTSIDFDVAFSHTSISRLHLNNNTISKWEELTKLSSAFPGLNKLVAGSLPLTEIPPVDSDIFSSLTSVYLNDSSLSDWASIENLASLSSLADLSVLNLPLAKDLKEKESRFAVIGRLPNLQSLNKSAITETEREDAERWLIRQFMDTPSAPPIYHALVGKHGMVERLADVNLAPNNTANVEIHFNNTCEQRTITTAQTLRKFKRWLSEEIVGLPPSSILVYYHDVGAPYGTEFLRYDNRPLYAYKVKDGDKIYVELKQSRD